MCIRDSASIAQCYELVWSDEFNGTTIDETKWSYQVGAWNGSQVQNCYDPDNSFIEDGSLIIEARHEPGFDCFGSPRDFSSGFVQTRNVINWTFGRFEARIRMPASDSTWPAFWMSPQDPVYGAWPRSGEIDISEVRGHDMTETTGNAHWGNRGSDRQQEKQPYTFPEGNGADHWHVYALEWRLGRLDFFLDGNHYGTINNFDEPNAASHPAPFDIGFYLRLNVAVGGTFLDGPFEDANNSLDQFPAAMEVDWVRVFQETGECEETVCNEILNGDFQEGTTDWTLFEFGDADGTLNSNGSNQVSIDISNTSTSNWHLALRQAGLNLKNGETYTVSVNAFAETARQADIIITNSSGGQYSFRQINLSTIPITFEHQFTMTQGDDPNAVFNISVGTGQSDVFVNSIIVTAQEIGESCDDGDACTTQDVIGEDCLCAGEYVDQDQDGYCIAIDPDDTNPCTPDFCPSTCEAVTNWDFAQGVSDWELFTFSNAAGSIIPNNGGIRIDVTSAGTNGWHLALRQNNILLEQGKSYIVRLEAYADADRSTSIILSEIGGSQYALLNQPLTTEPTVYYHQIDMDQASDPEAVLNLNVGASSSSVNVLHFSVSELSCVPRQDCVESILHSLPLTEDEVFTAKQFIRSSSTLTGDIQYISGQTIELISGFQTPSNNRTFLASIEMCD